MFFFVEASAEIFLFFAGKRAKQLSMKMAQ